MSHHSCRIVIDRPLQLNRDLDLEREEDGRWSGTYGEHRLTVFDTLEEAFAFANGVAWTSHVAFTPDLQPDIRP